MTDHTLPPARIDLRSVAMATAVVLGIATSFAVAYLLLDILLVLFIGVIVAAALQPWHSLLNQRGIPKGLAVLLIYLVLLSVLGIVVLIVGPLIIEQVTTFTADVPRSYTALRTWLLQSGSSALELLGQRMPPLERLTTSLAAVAPQLAQGTLGVTTSLAKVLIYAFSVFFIAFYWTIEVPRVERLVVSLLPVDQRPRALTIWHEIECKLGGFIRGQALVMLFIGLASGAGYWLIGLPNALALGILAGVMEVVPLIGPILAIGPALLVALAAGGNSVVAVLGLAALLHLIESNVLIPRVMHRTVGVSYLVSLLALLAFGTLYGIVGVLIAVPMAAMMQVLLDTMVTSAEAVPVVDDGLAEPVDELRARIQALRQHARVRLRARNSRMGIDPSIADHVVDAVDQQIESAATHIERLLAAAEQSAELRAEIVPVIVETLHEATEDVEHAVENADSAPDDVHASVIEELNLATQRFHAAIARVEKLVLSTNRTDFVAGSDGEIAVRPARVQPLPVKKAAPRAVSASRRSS